MATFDLGFPEHAPDLGAIAVQVSEAGNHIDQLHGVALEPPVREIMAAGDHLASLSRKVLAKPIKAVQVGMEHAAGLAERVLGPIGETITAAKLALQLPISPPPPPPPQGCTVPFLDGTKCPPGNPPGNIMQLWMMLPTCQYCWLPLGVDPGNWWRPKGGISYLTAYASQIKCLNAQLPPRWVDVCAAAPPPPPPPPIPCQPPVGGCPPGTTWDPVACVCAPNHPPPPPPPTPICDPCPPPPEPCPPPPEPCPPCEAESACVQSGDLGWAIDDCSEADIDAAYKDLGVDRSQMFGGRTMVDYWNEIEGRYSGIIWPQQTSRYPPEG